MAYTNDRIRHLAAALRADGRPGIRSDGLLTTANTAAVTEDPIVVTAACRTPIGRAVKGSFAEVPPDQLLATVLNATVSRAAIDPALVGDVCVGNCLQPGAGSMGARIASLLGGLPETTPVMSVNRQCSSGLQAFANVAGSIASGISDVGIAAGVESMSLNNMMDAVPTEMADMDAVTDMFGTDSLLETAENCLTPMGITSENVASKYGISRETQDAFALSSNQKALAAIANGAFKEEIVPVAPDPDEPDEVVDTDEGPRQTSMEKLGSLRGAFDEDGSTTAGNSSQMSDGAAAVLVMRASKAQELGQDVMGVFKGMAVVGCPPDIMGIGPAVAIPAALEKAGLSIDDIDIFEINEAFASQATYCVDKLNIPAEKVNPLGGAIALGHPLGCTGARQICTLLHQLKRLEGPGPKRGIVSMCIGTGMGAAAVFELP